MVVHTGGWWRWWWWWWWMCGLHPTSPPHRCSISVPDWRDEISPAKIKRSRCQNNSWYAYLPALMKYLVCGLEIIKTIRLQFQLLLWAREGHSFCQRWAQGQVETCVWARWKEGRRERGSSISHLRFEYSAIIVLKRPISRSAGRHYASTIWCDIQIRPKWQVIRRREQPAYN